MYVGKRLGEMVDGFAMRFSHWAHVWSHLPLTHSPVVRVNQCLRKCTWLRRHATQPIHTPNTRGLLSIVKRYAIENVFLFSIPLLE